MTTTVHAHTWHIESPAPGRHILQGTCACGAKRGFTGGIAEDRIGQSFNTGAAKRSASWKAQATLRLLAGEDVAEIAEDLGKSESAVRKLKRRIAEKVRQSA